MNRPESIPVSTSSAPIIAGALKYGRRNELAICRESLDESSSTMPSEALCTSLDAPSARVYTETVKA